MKAMLVFCLLVGVALARPGPDGQPDYIPILRSESDHSPDGGYSFSYETGNEIQREEVGEVRNAGQEDEFVVVRGSYSYKDPEGNLIEVTYTADENGFHAVGKHIHPSVGSPSAGRSGKALDVAAGAAQPAAARSIEPRVAEQPDQPEPVPAEER